MTLDATLTAGREAAEARMVDACTITRSTTSAPVFDEETGEYQDPEDDAVYDGDCEIQLSEGLNAQFPEVGGGLVAVQRVTVKVPISAVGVRVNDTVTVTRSANDPDLLGRVYRVDSTHAKTYATCRRLQCEEVTA